MSQPPDLLFGPGDPSGFTPAGISAFSGLNAAAVVRELIQNSLDAALGEAGEDCARVRFRRIEVQAKEIPGLASYKEAFQRAKQTQIKAGGGRMPTRAESVVGRIEDALENQYPHVLVVTDNGIGLNNDRMAALLSDGVSAKTESSAGTFGNGHSVVVPASDLRYVLYGGCIDGGSKICAGEAVIASQEIPGEEHWRSSRGFFIESFRSSGSGSMHRYATGSLVPPLIDREIEWIRQKYGHGAAVIVPYFNNFHDDRILKKMIERSAACNFFPAIHHGRLVVTIEDEIGDDGFSELNSGTLLRILSEYRHEKRVRRGAFLSGEKANEGYNMLRDGEEHVIDTALGQVSVRLQQGVGSHQVCLIRNGMWVTDNIPGLEKHRFSDRQPFQALLLFVPTNRNKLYELVQKAETPLHNALSIKQLSDDERRELRAAIKEVRKAILKIVPEVKSDSFSISGLLDVQFDAINRGQSGSRRPSFWGTPTVRRRTTATHAGPKSDGPTDYPGTRRNDPYPEKRRPESRVTLHPSAFHVASAPVGHRRQRIQIVSKQACADAHLRLIIDENVDATCDPQSQSDSALATLSDITINGKAASSTLVNGVPAINLGDLAEGDRVLVETSFDVPDDLLTLSGQHPSLRVEVVRASPNSSEAKTVGPEESSAND